MWLKVMLDFPNYVVRITDKRTNLWTPWLQSTRNRYCTRYMVDAANYIIYIISEVKKNKFLNENIFHPLLL